MTDRDDGPEPARPDRAGHGRRVYVWWAVGLGLLGALGLFCWLFLRPCLEARAVVTDLAPRVPMFSLGIVPDLYENEGRAAVVRLGGERRAAHCLGLYLRLPKPLAPELPTAAWLLKYCGLEAVPVLLRLTGHPDAEVRAEAIEAVAGFKLHTVEVIAAMVAALRDPFPAVREPACRAFLQFGEDTPELPPQVVNGLVAALDDPDPNLRLTVVTAILKVRPVPPTAVPGLVRALKDQHVFLSSVDMPPLRSGAALALARLGPQARKAVPDLVEALERDHPVVRQVAAMALGEIGPDARAAVPALEECLKLPENSSLHSIAADVLRKIRGEGPSK